MQITNYKLFASNVEHIYPKRTLVFTLAVNKISAETVMNLDIGWGTSKETYHPTPFPDFSAQRFVVLHLPCSKLHFVYSTKNSNNYITISTQNYTAQVLLSK